MIDLAIWIGFTALGWFFGYQLGQVQAALRLLRPGETYQSWSLEVRMPIDPE